MKATITGVVLLAILSACSSSIVPLLKNTSPEPVPQDINHLMSIPASIAIKADEKKFVSDVSVALSRNNVFSSIVADDKKSELLLTISHKTIADHHLNEGMGDAVLSGLTFGLSGDNPDIFDYSISIEATLIYKGKTIASYNSKGSYHSEISDAADLNSKLTQTTEAVKLSFNHALNLLSEKIKKDREKIITAMKNPQ